MRWIDAAWLSAGNLKKDPLRTILTILGLAVGVAAVLAVITLGAAGEVQVEREIDKLGVDKVWIAPEGERELSADSAAAAAASAGTQACAAAYAVGAAAFAGDAVAVTAAGYDQGVEAVMNPTLLAGRMFTPREFREGAAVALVDDVLWERWGEGVLNQRIQLGGRLVRVVGVVRSMAAQASTGTVYLPLNGLMYAFGDRAISEITLTVPRGIKADDVAALALGALGDGYRASTLQEEIDAARAVVRIFVMVLACVAVVCVITGGIGVMNILLVSLRERRREIGLIKAVGGTARQVAALFLLEAMGYAVLGGALGLVLGLGLIRLCGALIGIQAALKASTAAAVLSGAALLGTVFGVLPAVKAAHLLPVEALKQP